MSKDASILSVTSSAMPPTSLPEDVALCHQIILELQQSLHKEQRMSAGLQQQLDQLLRRLYGPRQEKFDPNAMSLFPELKALMEQVSAAQENEKPVIPAAETPSANKPKRTSTGRKPFPASLRREEERYELSETDRQCPDCQVTCEPISEESSEQLDYIPASLFVREHIRCTYGCPNCKAHLVTAAKPPQPIEKGIPAAGLIAQVAVSKYGDHLPLHRQEQIHARHGVEISRSTMCDWMAGAAETLKPLYDAMAQEVLASRVIHTDDTRVSMQDKKTIGKTVPTRFWTYVGDDEHPLVVFDFTLSRERDGPAKFLKNYSGAIQADGYSGYDGIAIAGKNPRAGCWSHGRRHFYDARKSSDPVLYAEVMARIGKLFAIEREIAEQLDSLAKERWEKLAKELGKDTSLSMMIPPIIGAEADAIRLKYRQERTISELTALHHFLDEQKKSALPKSPWAQALNYALNQWDDLTIFTKLGCLAIDNNISERTLRGIAIGRKNWLFVGSPQGGQTAAVFFSLIASCKRNKVEPWNYLRHVLVQLATPKTSQELYNLFPHHCQLAAR